MNTETAFISKIDCNFDYHNYQQLVKEALTISELCVEMIVYEVIFLPRSVNVSLAHRLEILNYIDLPVSKVGIKILTHKKISFSEKVQYRLLFP